MASKEKYLANLFAPSALMGREYIDDTLGKYLSEGALHLKRAEVQLRFLQALANSEFPLIRKLSDLENDLIETSITKLGPWHAKQAALFDHFGLNGIGPLEHDVKAVEHMVRGLLQGTSLEDLMDFVHYPLTSEDVNNIAYNLMFVDVINQVWMKEVYKVGDKLRQLTLRYANTPVLGLTHGQPASPTTIGKRFAYFLENLVDVVEQLFSMVLTAKCSGPVGNHNAITAVAPGFDFDAHARKFVEDFGFEYTPVVHQRNSHSRMVRVLKLVGELNMVLYDLSENVWLNLSRGWLTQLPVESHVGSSVMPHKVNPWFFELAEGYAQVSNALIRASEVGLSTSRFERDLSDHPWERVYGDMFGYSLVALSYVNQGLSTLVADEDKALEDLQKHPEVLAEAIQIAGKSWGVQDPYAKLKSLTRGKTASLEELREVLTDMLPMEGVAVLKDLSPETYIGKAPEICDMASERYLELRRFISSRTFLLTEND